MKNQAGMNPKKRNARSYVSLLAAAVFLLCVPCTSMAADWENKQLSCTVTVKETCQDYWNVGKWKSISLVYVVKDDPKTTSTYECGWDCGDRHAVFSVLRCKRTNNVKNIYSIESTGFETVDARAGTTQSQACKQLFDKAISVFKPDRKP